jgi:hypothetical protein
MRHVERRDGARRFTNHMEETMKPTKRKEVLTLVKPAQAIDAIPRDQADSELRHVAIVAYVAGFATWFIACPLIGFLLL